jgi:hypothetical protein
VERPFMPKNGLMRTLSQPSKQRNNKPYCYKAKPA